MSSFRKQSYKPKFTFCFPMFKILGSKRLSTVKALERSTLIGFKCFKINDSIVMEIVDVNHQT